MPSKITQTKIMKAALTGELPLDVLLNLMRTTEDEKLKLEAAKAAAPYLHNRLAPIDKLPSKTESQNTDDDDHILPDFSALVRQR